MNDLKIKIRILAFAFKVFLNVGPFAGPLPILNFSVRTGITRNLPIAAVAAFWTDAACFVLFGWVFARAY
jgi:hypothetical protein